MKRFKVLPIILIGYTILIFSYTAFFARLLKHYGKFNLSSFILILLVIPVLVYYISLLAKEVKVDDEGICVKGIFRKKEFKWENMDSVMVTHGRKTFIFLTLKDGTSAIIDDTLGNFEELMKIIGKNVKKEALPDDWDRIVNSYKRSNFSIILVYIAGLLLLFVVLKSFIG